MKTKTQKSAVIAKLRLRAAVRKVTDICVCHLPYQPHPFVIGTISDPKSDTGKSNVWLQNDGQWTQDEASAECYLRIGSWNPPNGGRKA